MPKRKPTKNQPEQPKPTTFIQGMCLATLVVLYGISAYTEREVPLIIYAIIAGVLFGVGNVKSFLGGGR